MPVAKEAKKSRTKKSEPNTISVSELKEKTEEKPLAKKKISKPSIEKVQKLTTETQASEPIIEEIPINLHNGNGNGKEKPTANKKVKSSAPTEVTNSYLISFENPEELKLKEEIANFATASGNLQLNKAILLLIEKGLRNGEAKQDVNFENKLNEISEKFKNLEEKMHSEFYTFKVEFIEQFQCFIEATRSQGDDSQPKEQKGWLQNILKYI